MRTAITRGENLMTCQWESVPAGESIQVLEHQIDRERISRRAYEIYEARRRVDGHADEDWFQAAAEYAAHRRREPIPFDHYRGNSSFSNRSRRVR